MSTKASSNVVEWVERAKAFYKATGKDIALAEFSNPRGQFVQSQRYIFVLDLNGVMLAHGMNRWYTGKDFLQVKDSAGRAFVKDIVDTAKEKGAGQVEYMWVNPVSKKELPKVLYFERVGDMIFCCGTYKEVPDPSDLELL